MAGLALLAWCVYLGGALTMELVWRPAQRALPPAQTGVACAVMGRRYRWVALGALAAAGAGLGWLVPGSSLLLWASWAALVALVAYTAVRAHPALHVRMDYGLDEAQRRAARAAVARAIRHMDVVLRVELAVALVATLLLARALDVPA